MSDIDDPPEASEDPAADTGGEARAGEVVLLDSDEEKDVRSNGREEGGSDSESSGEEVAQRLVVAWQCLNSMCTVARRDRLLTADSYTLSYYGLQPDSGRKRKVCGECRAGVERGRAALVGRLRAGGALLEDRLPVPGDMVVLEDSDEEPVTDSSGDSEFEIDVSSEDSDDQGKTAEEKLNGIIDRALGSFDMKTQFEQATKVLTERMDAMKDDFAETDNMFKDLEAEVDGLRRELYRGHTATIQELPAVDLNKEERPGEAGRGQAAAKSSGPPRVPAAPASHQFPRPAAPLESAPPAGGPLEGPGLARGQMAYAMRQNILQVWRKGRVEEVQAGREAGGEPHYKLRFEGQCGGKRSVQSKVLPPRHLAYTAAARARLAVGTRCIGLYKELPEQEGAFYSGVIAEPPKAINGNRYLVFFDDGYASYISHADVRVVCKASPNVWEDIHPNSKEFIQQYLEQYPERPMVKLTVGQVVKTEWDGKWWISRVNQVDASLVKLVFDADGRTEWIYRGSTRLGPLFTEMEQQRLRRQQGQGQPGGFGRRQTLPSKRRSGPYVEYRRDEPGEAAAASPASSLADSSQDSLDNDGAPHRRAVARKSTASRKPEVAASSRRWELEGATEPVDLPAAPRRKLRPHHCGPGCVSDPQHRYQEAEHKQYNLLLVPVLVGWERVVSKHRQGGRRKVFYVAPCGRRLRGLEEVHRYLRLTGSKLEIDFFNFDWWLHVRNEFKPTREFCTIKDLSYGKENVPVSCVNSIDRNYPEYVEYSTVRLPQKNVNINTGPDFMTCCDCTDDCQNKDKCACWQMTIQGTAADVDGTVDRNAGYSHRRLSEIVLTGIFECNSRCQCAKTCLNRVAQHPLRMKLQVFKTEKRGWGIRTLHDIPQGSFICVYVGNLFESEEANKQGQNFGDEYFAELDMIEVVERRKDGYESDVSDEGYDEAAPSPPPAAEGAAEAEHSVEAAEPSEENVTEEEDTDGGNSPDEDFTPNLNDLHMEDDDEERRDHRKRGVSQLDGANDSDSDDLEVVKETVKHKEAPRRGGFSATVGILGPKVKKQQKERFVSTRKLYGRSEDVYIMDAKSIGNIGRYLNHSCNPNVFVQNVFVDTHDMR
jgi:histone-lysine N-methyltransferase SETDB1